MVGFQPLNHHKQKCNMFPNDNHVEVTQGSPFEDNPTPEPFQSLGSQRSTERLQSRSWDGVEKETLRTTQPGARFSLPGIGQNKSELFHLPLKMVFPKST